MLKHKETEKLIYLFNSSDCTHSIIIAEIEVDNIETNINEKLNNMLVVINSSLN